MSEPKWGAIYAETRERLSALAIDHADAAGTWVPACPAWTVHDVLAHVTGFTVDLLEQRFDGMGTDAWSAAQVDVRRGHSIGEIVDEWRARSPEFEAGLDVAGAAVAEGAVAGLASHEQDVRQALAAPGARDSKAITIAFHRYGADLGTRIDQRGLSALRLVAGGDEYIAGSSTPDGALRADHFTIVRVLTGRRSVAQIRALDWDGDPSPYLDVLSRYGSRDTDLVE